MIDIATAVRYTPKKAKRKANGVVVRLQYALKGFKLNEGWYYLFIGYCTDTRSQLRNKHRFFIKRYLDDKLKNQKSKIKALCDCENFMYVWEVALTKQHSAVRYKSNGKKPVMTNPRMLPGVCKHLLAAIKATYKLKPTRLVKNIKLPRNF